MVVVMFYFFPVLYPDVLFFVNMKSLIKKKNAVPQLSVDACCMKVS